jgi:CubicO group peptidase (beta-lactamase class C family)
MMWKSQSIKLLLAATLYAVSRAAAVSAQTQPNLEESLRVGIDRTVQQVLASTGVPSASIAIVKDGQIAHVQAYGEARLSPPAPARPGMRYAIGSISKQFTAAAVVMLAEEHRLSLDDPVSKFLPGLTRAGEVSIRQLLSHTSGYQDYWPQDYVPPDMLQETTPERILERWAGKPLDFEPGTQYQYSNTGYVIAGRIVEKAGGVPLLEFLRQRIFVPLRMESVTDVNQSRLASTDPIGYLRYALGPPRAAPKEGRGWLFAAAELAMTAGDLARWNVAMIEGRLLTPASWKELETEVVLKSGLGTRYGLGLDVTTEAGHRALEHGGEVSGFTASNTVFPDDRAAVSVLTNQDAAQAASAIARKIAPLLLAKGIAADSETRARRILEGLQKGKIDRSLFTANASAYFTTQAVADFSASLTPLGKLLEVKQTAERERGGMTFHAFDAKFARKTVTITERDMPDGKIEQFQVAAKSP